MRAGHAKGTSVSVDFIHDFIVRLPFAPTQQIIDKLIAQDACKDRKVGFGIIYSIDSAQYGAIHKTAPDVRFGGTCKFRKRVSIFCFLHENPGIIWPCTPVQGNEKHFDVISGVVNSVDDEIECSDWFRALL